MKLVIALIIFFLCSCSNKTEHKVTDSIIYWNNQELTNESP